MINKEADRLIRKFGEKVLDGGSLDMEEALSLDERICVQDLPALFEVSSRIREEFFGRSIRLCAISNAKSGYCAEDCGFCAQSMHHETQVVAYPLLSTSQIIEKAAQAEEAGVHCFSLVASGGKTETRRELDSLCEAIHLINQQFPSISCAVSLGTISSQAFSSLKEAGLHRYHHNLETAESFFQKVCTTHTFQQRRDTIERAKSFGIKVCSGGIFGLGETSRQRLELAFTLRELKVDSIPINFLHPIAGTRYQDQEPIFPLDALKAVSLFRFIMPRASIHICGGRQTTLRTLQSWTFLAGANGLMVGNYLTTKGGQWEDDLAMIQDLGFTTSRKLS